jgi:hypothetical protein
MKSLTQENYRSALSFTGFVPIENKPGAYAWSRPLPAGYSVVVISELHGARFLSDDEIAIVIALDHKKNPITTQWRGPLSEARQAIEDLSRQAIRESLRQIDSRKLISEAAEMAGQHIKEVLSGPKEYDAGIASIQGRVRRYFNEAITNIRPEVVFEDSAIELLDIGRMLETPNFGYRWVFEEGVQTYLQTSSDREGEDEWHLMNGTGDAEDDPDYFLEVNNTPESLLEAIDHLGSKPWVDKESLIAAILPAIRTCLEDMRSKQSQTLTDKPRPKN